MMSRITLRSRLSRGMAAARAALALALMGVLLAASPVAADNHTTSSTTVDATTVTTAGTATTVAPGETTTTAPPVPGAISAQPGVTPAPAGYVPVNPGLVAARFDVQVWPEYDTKDVLVLVDVTLPATTVFPYEFSFYVPKGARLGGLAEITETNGFDYTLGTPRTTPGEAFDLITVTVPKRPVLRLEYYYDPGVGAPGAKSYPLRFQASADVGSMSFGVQQPLGATDFIAEPGLSQSSTDGQGFTYHFGSFNAIKAGDTIEVQVSYTKTSAEPSVSGGDPNGGQTTQGAGGNTMLLIIAAVLVVIVGIVAYRVFLAPQGAGAGKGGGQRRAAPQGGRVSGGRTHGATKGSTRAPGAASGAGGPSRFCTQCGGQLQKRDRFCPQCGSERE